MFILFDVLHQNPQRNLSRKSQSSPNFNGKNTRVYDDNDKYGVGLFTLSIYEEFSSKQKEEKEDKEAQNEKVYEAKGSDRKLNKHLTTYRPRGHVPENYKCLLKSQSQQNNRSIIWSTNSGKTPTQKTYDRVSTEDRSGQFPSTYPSSKSKSGSVGKERVLGSWQLLRDEYMDSSKSSKTQYANSDSHNRQEQSISAKIAECPV
jgi:hypothetical protein